MSLPNPNDKTRPDKALQTVRRGEPILAAHWNQVVRAINDLIPPVRPTSQRTGAGSGRVGLEPGVEGATRVFFVS